MVERYDGYYYNWYVATAGTGTSSMTSGDATGSICPKGWRLPSIYASDPDKSFGNLTLSYLGFYNNRDTGYVTTLEGIPFNFRRAGWYDENGFEYGGTYGRYWTSRVSNGNAYLLAYSTSNTYPQHVNPKYYGYTIRCVNI